MKRMLRLSKCSSLLIYMMGSRTHLTPASKQEEKSYD